MDGLKLKPGQENPFDNILYYFSAKVAPIFHKNKITPNQVTFFSFICSLLSMYCLYKKKYIYSALLWLLSYFFDCLDGYLARKYKQFSKFGDLYDHISDIFSFILLLYIFDLKKKYKELRIIVVFIILTMVHISCQEKIYNKKKESLSLNSFNICPYHNMIKLTRWFGPGTLNLVIIMFILRGDK